MNEDNCVKALSAEDVDQLKSEAFHLGMTNEDVANVINQYGPTMLSILVTGIRSGMGLSFCLELVKLFGPMVFNYVVNIFSTSKKMEMVSGQSATQNSDAIAVTAVAHVLKNSSIESFPPEIITILLEKLLPWALEKYGQQIISAIVESILSNLKKDVKFSVSN